MDIVDDLFENQFKSDWHKGASYATNWLSQLDMIAAIDGFGRFSGLDDMLKKHPRKKKPDGNDLRTFTIEGGRYSDLDSLVKKEPNDQLAPVGIRRLGGKWTKYFKEEHNLGRAYPLCPEHLANGARSWWVRDLHRLDQYQAKELQQRIISFVLAEIKTPKNTLRRARSRRGGSFVKIIELFELTTGRTGGKKSDIAPGSPLEALTYAFVYAGTPRSSSVIVGKKVNSKDGDVHYGDVDVFLLEHDKPPLLSWSVQVKTKHLDAQDRVELMTNARRALSVDDGTTATIIALGFSDALRGELKGEGVASLTVEEMASQVNGWDRTKQLEAMRGLNWYVHGISRKAGLIRMHRDALDGLSPSVIREYKKAVADKGVKFNSSEGALLWLDSAVAMDASVPSNIKLAFRHGRIAQGILSLPGDADLLGIASRVTSKLMLSSNGLRADIDKLASQMMAASIQTMAAVRAQAAQ